jgi:putative Ca2+/H+ antiporter (TMEM165/GDT1 family)
VAGVAAVTWIPKVLVHYAVIGLMLFFGVQLVRQGLKLSSDAGFDELEEVESETRKKDEEEGRVNENTHARSAMAVMIEAFTLTFLAEWGDRSQLATIALTASNSPIGVMIGGFIGHALCTGFAVVGGRMLANYVSERTVTLAGGALFILFALYALMMGY